MGVGGRFGGGVVGWTSDFSSGRERWTRARPGVLFWLLSEHMMRAAVKACWRAHNAQLVEEAVLRAIATGAGLVVVFAHPPSPPSRRRVPPTKSATRELAKVV